MKSYQRLWVAVFTPLAVVGLGLGLVFVPLAEATLAPFSGALAAILAWVWLVPTEEVRQPPRANARVVTKTAFFVGAAIGALVGFAALGGAAALFPVIVVLASSPHAVSAYGRWWRSVPTPSIAQLDKVVRALSYASPEYLTYQSCSGVGALTDEELCRSWRASDEMLQHPGSAAQAAMAVAERQTYLDELERRNPRGFAAWLASGPQASADPLPFLCRGWDEQPAINWDELIRGQDW